MFNLPILNILDGIKDEKGICYLDKIILHLYEEEKFSSEDIAIMLGISKSIIYQRIPEDVRKKNKKRRKKEEEEDVISRYKAGDWPKKISIEMEISPTKIYKIIKAYKLSR